VTFLDAYLALAWILCIMAVMLVKRSKSHTPRWIDVPAIVIFALGWPIVLPVVALILWGRGESPES